MTTLEGINKTNQCNIGSVISVPICDFILTPVSCASLVNEVLKNLLYQRSQIPYPYAWLKNIVRKKRQSLEERDEKKINLSLNRHYQTVSGAYDSAENIMSNIIKTFKCYGKRLKEVIFVIGVTPVCAKEVFTIKVTSLDNGHIESNHVAENSKKQPKILRSIFLEQSWMHLVENTLSCSNTYIFLKINGSPDCVTRDADSIFLPSNPVSFPPKMKHTVINFNYSNSPTIMCCDMLEIFKDFCDSDSPRKSSNVSIDQNEEGNDEETWLQSNILIHGFKDCFINRVSASELW